MMFFSSLGADGGPTSGDGGFLAPTAGIPAGRTASFAEVPALSRPACKFQAVSRGTHFAIPWNAMMKDSALARLAATTKTLGHPARLRILAMLRQNRLSVCQIASVLGVAPSTASNYLIELRRADLVTEQRQGKWVYYRLTDETPIDALLRFVLVLIGADEQVQQDALSARRLGGSSPDLVCTALAENRPLAVSEQPPRE
jgi:ArsR family transcriptional regulator